MGLWTIELMIIYNLLLSDVSFTKPHVAGYIMPLFRV
jgi:hypothetical protein